MRKIRSLPLLLLCFSFYGCEGQTKIVFSDELMNQYPSDPAVFQAKYGGDLTYYRGDAEVKQKMADVDKAFIEGDGFEVVFWKAKDFYIHHIKLTKNHLKVGNVSLIGKKADEIQRILGPTSITAAGAMIYRGKEMVLTLGVDNATIVDCYWGFEI